MTRLLTGGVPWDKLAPFLRRIAVADTSAHLELAFAQGSIAKDLQEGLVYYRLP